MAEGLTDAVGEQGHAFSTRGPNHVMQASLDSLAELGLPLYITELDIDGPTDEVQTPALRFDVGAADPLRDGLRRRADE